jgi:dTDP-4-amino-4,6-dideoxygalactose transaminase
VPAITELVRGRNIKVIEDCAQAHGAEINGQSVGSFGDAAAFSFCQDKIISTAGEGGLLMIKDSPVF